MDYRDLQKYSKPDIDAVFHKFMAMDPDEIKTYCEGKEGKRTALEATIGTIFYKAFVEGDEKRMDQILNRTIGKVAEKVEIDIPEPWIIKDCDGTELMHVEFKKKEEDK